MAGMATNLRLRPDAQEALRTQAATTGRSQQELIREAVDRYLGLAPEPVPRTAEGALSALLASGAVLVARTDFRESDKLLPMPRGLSTLRLLDRDDRI
jgi:Ribbon-helix-helix protein, copG family